MRKFFWFLALKWFCVNLLLFYRLYSYLFPAILKYNKNDKHKL
mgnify:CR=1 FL=1